MSICCFWFGDLGWFVRWLVVGLCAPLFACCACLLVVLRCVVGLVLLGLMFTLFSCFGGDLSKMIDIFISL